MNDMHEISNQKFSASLEIIVYELCSKIAGGIKELFKRTAKAFIYRYSGNISSVRGLAF
jgi:hypothetical protein